MPAPEVTTVSPRVRIEREPGGLRVIIRSKQSWFLTLVFGAWLVLYTVVAASIYIGVVTLGWGGYILSAVLFLVWLLAAVLTGGSWYWKERGSEVVTLQQGSLTISRGAGSWRRFRTYDVRQIINLRAATGPAGMSLDRSEISFKYQDQLVRFAVGLSDRETVPIAEAIRGQIIADLASSVQ